MHFQTYIQNLPISNSFKEQILDKQFIESNPIYYQNYPSLFANAFSISSKNIELLDIAGYLYYQATIFTDSLIDEKDITKFPLITICQEESIKILTNIYGLENNFWNCWNKRKNEYLQAIYLEKELSRKEIATIEEYEVLADNKAAFGKVAIDCLFCIDNKNEDLYNKLLLSHKYFSVAFQLNDDIQDFKEDLVNIQFNWAIYILKQQKITTKDPNILEKYLYIRGISKQIYLLGIDYCNKALNIVENLDVSNWIKVLNDTKKRFSTAIIEVDNYLEILSAEINLSNDKFLENNLKNSILSATNFIKSKQQKDGSWREYLNQGGISNTWATAFIISKISENEPLKNEFKNEIASALDFLKLNAIKTLWSYNTTWIEDADSTNFVLLTYLLNDIKINQQVLEKWLLFQNRSGGFSTYFDENQLKNALDDSNIKSINGWLSTHNCVSAVSFYFLAKQNKQSDYFVKSKDYFEDDFYNDHNSYWWTSEIYTLYYLAKTFQVLNEFEKVRAIIKKIKSLQNQNGSFSDKYGENLFYTGLALEIVLIDNYQNSKIEIDKTVLFLLQNQYNDGSWHNSNALQVPNPEDLKPAKSHFPITTFGTNVRAKEFNRLFTTTAILQSLSIYEQRYNSTTF